jgi:DNA-binding transcriptional LysR family regulator
LNNYKLLPALVSILQTRNLTHTAKELNVTQSAMSKTLNQIRVAFSDQILLREGAHFILTKRGQELKSELPSLLFKLDDLYLPSLMDPLSCNRKFTLASSDYVAQAIFPSISKSIELQAPNASVEYLLWKKDQILDLGENSIDLVTTMVEVVPENIYGKLMAEDRLVAIFSSSHSFSSNPLSINDYCKAKHITISGGGDKDLLVDIELSLLGKKRKIFANVPFSSLPLNYFLQQIQY